MIPYYKYHQRWAKSLLLGVCDLIIKGCPTCTVLFWRRKSEIAGTFYKFWCRNGTRELCRWRRGPGRISSRTGTRAGKSWADICTLHLLLLKYLCNGFQGSWRTLSVGRPRERRRLRQDSFGQPRISSPLPGRTQCRILQRLCKVGECGWKSWPICEDLLRTEMSCSLCRYLLPGFAQCWDFSKTIKRWFSIFHIY